MAMDGKAQDSGPGFYFHANDTEPTEVDELSPAWGYWSTSPQWVRPEERCIIPAATDRDAFGTMPVDLEGCRVDALVHATEEYEYGVFVLDELEHIIR
ncbi:hypothetical protein PLICRDRAFT_228076 [Plicaturopsis crispa FD-325 SS-3]|nr:hypothetical protein PLICRDRAFT_228076 [Plicaturopsis crispa FD-325 SS-3]